MDTTASMAFSKFNTPVARKKTNLFEFWQKQNCPYRSGHSGGVFQWSVLCRKQFICWTEQAARSGLVAILVTTLLYNSNHKANLSSPFVLLLPGRLEQVAGIEAELVEFPEELILELFNSNYGPKPTISREAHKGCTLPRHEHALRR